MKSNREIRAAARASLGNNIFSDRWISGLILLIILSVANSLASYLIGLILIGGVTLGISYSFLSLVRGAPRINIGDIMKGFENGNFGRSFLLYIISNIFLFLWSLLFFIPGIVKSYSYRLAYYVALDHPDYGANDCITESRRLMNGHKMQAFLLDLSFIGWILVGVLLCGIGVFFVSPYIEASRAHFYEAILVADGSAPAKSTEEIPPLDQ